MADFQRFDWQSCDAMEICLQAKKSPARFLSETAPDATVERLFITLKDPILC